VPRASENTTAAAIFADRDDILDLINKRYSEAGSEWTLVGLGAVGRLKLS